jgi:hypothetical protein
LEQKISSAVATKTVTKCSRHQLKSKPRPLFV